MTEFNSEAYWKSRYQVEKHRADDNLALANTRLAEIVRLKHALADTVLENQNKNIEILALQSALEILQQKGTHPCSNPEPSSS
jgi:hypothetical protein